MAFTFKDATRLFQVKPGRKFSLKHHDPGWAGDGEFGSAKRRPSRSVRSSTSRRTSRSWRRHRNCSTPQMCTRCSSCSRPWTRPARTARSSTSCPDVNPQGCQVFSFKRPSDEELDHNFLWRYMKALPERGRIGIFNRSYYEEVLVVRVHPEILAQQKLPPGNRGRKFWDARFDDINRFERHLTRNGTLILKFFLHLSKKEQKRRFLDRLDDAEKHWKFSTADLKERTSGTTTRRRSPTCWSTPARNGRHGG